MTSASTSQPLTSSSPAFFASIIGLVVAVGMIAFGGWLQVQATTPIPLNIGLMVVGLIEGASSFYTLQRSRVAWSFALSINGTGFVVFLFCAPRIRDSMDAHIAVALIPCLIFGFLVLLHSLHNEEF